MATNEKRPGPAACRRRMRWRLLVDLGMVEETMLNPNWVPGQLAREYRNSLEDQ